MVIVLMETSSSADGCVETPSWPSRPKGEEVSFYSSEPTLLRSRVTPPLGLMKQSFTMYIGAAIGGLAWLSFRSSPVLPGAFLSMVIAAWAAVGLFGILRAKLTLAGYGGRPPKTYTGLHARLVGCAIVAASLAFALLMIHVGR